MKRARWFLNNGYSVKRTAEITSVPAEVCERIKNGWPQDSPEGLQDQERKARQIHQGQERVAAYRGEKETEDQVHTGDVT